MVMYVKHNCESQWLLLMALHVKHIYESHWLITQLQRANNTYIIN